MVVEIDALSLASILAFAAVGTGVGIDVKMKNRVTADNAENGSDGTHRVAPQSTFPGREPCDEKHGYKRDCKRRGRRGCQRIDYLAENCKRVENQCRNRDTGYQCAKDDDEHRQAQGGEPLGIAEGASLAHFCSHAGQTQEDILERSERTYRRAIDAAENKSYNNPE